MRFDTPIIFRTVVKSYDATTGNYAETTTSEVTKYASVDNTTERIMTLVYGGAKQDSITARLQNHYDSPFTDIVICGKAYKVDYRSPLRIRDVFVLSRV